MCMYILINILDIKMSSKIRSLSFIVKEPFDSEKVGGRAASVKFYSKNGRISLHQIDGTNDEPSTSTENTIHVLYLLLEENDQMDIQKTRDLGYFEKLNKSIKEGRNSKDNIYLICTFDGDQLIGYAYFITMNDCTYITEIRTIKCDDRLVEISQCIIEDIILYNASDTIYIMGGESQCRLLHDKLTIEDATIYGFTFKRALALEVIMGPSNFAPKYIETLRIVTH
ncbi:hypothetical protein D3C87_1071970 [compost metagenome]